VASGEKMSIEAIVSLANLKPEDVSAELYFGSMDSSGNIERGEYAPLQLMEGTTPGTYTGRADLVLTDGGEYGYNFRILPASRDLADKFELRLVKWAE
jgi:starch phosphorylase